MEATATPDPGTPLPLSRIPHPTSHITYLVALFAILLMSEALLPSAHPFGGLAAAAPLTSAGKRQPATGEWWMGIYLESNKLGYVHCTTAPARGLKGGGYRVRTATWTCTGALGYTQEQRIDVDEHLAPDLRPVRMDVRMVSSGKVVRVDARFLTDRVEVERREGDNVARHSLPIPPGASLAADVETALLNRDVEPGQTWTYLFFNAITLSLEDATTRVLRHEMLDLDGKPRKTTVTQTSSATTETTSWLLEDGQPAKMVMYPRITMVRESREQAMAGLDEQPYDPSRDLATQLAVQTEGRVEAPGRVKYLRLRVSGIPEKRFVLSDARQAAAVAEGAAPLTVEYTVDAAAEAPRAPLSPEERAKLLAPTAYLQADHPEIVARAREATEGATDDDARVQALWRWVHAHLRTRGDIGLPRTALDVLREPVGMCRDYAVLYAALARAAGIPTRVCAGIVYFRDRFYYHAWAESHAAGRWVPVDGTVAAGFVDASHIKFAQGDGATLYGATKIIGRLRAEVLEQR